MFSKDALVTKDLTLQAPTEQDKLEWIRALRLHQIDLFRARSSFFENWLGKQGVKVPGAPQEQIQTSQFKEEGVDAKQEAAVDMNQEWAIMYNRYITKA